MPFALVFPIKASTTSRTAHATAFWLRPIWCPPRSRFLFFSQAHNFSLGVAFFRKNAFMNQAKTFGRTFQQTNRTACAFVAMLIMWIPISFAQTYPEKAVRLIVPAPPGGGTDIIARILGTKLAERWRIPVVIDNRGGANTIVGTQLAAQAMPDGYTILLITAGFAINPSVYPKLPFDALTDFSPVSSVASGAFALVVHPTVPAKSVKELIALANSRPGTLNFASSGTGSPNHLAGEMFKSRAQLNITHVPYKGAGPVLTALVSGEVDMAFGSMVAAPPLMKAGKIRGLAVTTVKRSAVMPDLPTMSEAGLPGFNVSSWFGMVAPARTPDEIIVKLNKDITDVLNMPDVRRRFISEGLEPVDSTPEQFGGFILSEIKRWAKVVRDSGSRAR